MGGVVLGESRALRGCLWVAARRSAEVLCEMAAMGGRRCPWRRVAETNEDGRGCGTESRTWFGQFDLLRHMKQPTMVLIAGSQLIVTLVTVGTHSSCSVLA